MKHSILKATVIVTVFSLVTRGLSFIYRIYLSRMLGSEGLGLYQIALSLFSVFVTLTSSGLPVAISKRTATARAENDERAEFSTVTAALITGLVLTAVIAGSMYLFQGSLSFIFSDPRCMSIFTLLLPAVMTSAMYSTFRGSLWGRKDFFSYSLTELWEEIVMIASGILLLQGMITILDGAKSAALSISISYIGGALLTIIIYFIKGGKLRSPRGSFKPLLKSAVPITGIRIASTSIQTLVAFILPVMLSKYMPQTQAVSEYGAMMGMAFPMLFLPSTLIGSLALVLVPELSTMTAKGEKTKLNLGIERAFVFSAFICFMILPIFLGAGSQLCEVMYNSPLAGQYLTASAVLIVPMGLNQICTTMINSLGSEMKTFLNSIIGSSLILICVLALPGVCGIYCLPIGFMLSLTVSTTLNMKEMRKRTGLSLKFLKQILMLLIITLPSALLCYTMTNLLVHFMHAIFAIAIASAASLIFFFLLTYIFNIIDISVIRSVCGKKKKQKLLTSFI